MAAQREPNQVEIISGIKGALNRQKSKFSRRISNVHKLRDLDQTFQALGKVAEAVVKGKYGLLRDRYQHEICPIYSMLERTMIRAKKGIYRRLSPWMSKIHPWMIFFDVPMPQEVFNLLNKGVVNLTRFGVDVLEQPYSVTITFSSMRRLCAQGFTKKLVVGKGEVKLIVDERRNVGIEIPLWPLECLWYPSSLKREQYFLYSY